MTNKYEWLNKDSRKFLERGYLLEGETAEQRIRDIADASEKYLNITGFADKFEDYSFINADIRKHVTDYIVEDTFFQEAMNVPVRKYQSLHNGEFLPPIEAFSAFFVGSTMNFIRHVDQVSQNFENAHSVVDEQTFGVMNDFRNVKTREDFEYWLHHAGSSLDSSPIEDGQPSSLPEDF